MKLNDERTLCTVNINQQLDASGIEAVIRRLALARSDMQPPVPAQPPTPGADAQPEVLAADDNGFAALVRSDGVLLLWLRVSGIGWISVRLPPERVNGLVHHLLASGYEQPPGPSLFSHDLGNTH